VSTADDVRAGARWWEDEGRRIGAALDRQSCLLVAAQDPEDAAALALGIGAAQARHRRVVVADLAGELAAIQRLVPADQADGIGDAFRYGVSLNRIARPVGTTGNLYVLPSGTEPVAEDEIYGHDRWRRLIAGFREVEALLLLVVPPNAPALASLATHTDGAVLAGEVALPAGVAVLDVARPPISERRSVAPVQPTPSDLRATAADEAVAADAVPEELLEPRRRRWRGAIIGATLLAAGVAAVVIVARGTRFDRGAPIAAGPTPPPVPERTIDSAAVSVDAEQMPVENPADSAAAALYAVELAKYSTSLGALLRVRDELPASLPGRTFAVVPIGADRTLWYRVLAGVTPSRRSADSLLTALRAAGVIDDASSGTVVSVPLAFRLRESVTPVAATTLVRQYLARGVPAYALRQPDGSIDLYAGAFESPEQAGLLAPLLRAAGVEPTLVYRTGRTF
jgi:hypothetical protein